MDLNQVVYSLFISTYFLERSHPQAVPFDSPEFRLIIENAVKKIFEEQTVVEFLMR